MRLKIKCPKCPRTFYEENNRNVHLLFGHEFLMPVCSTGIDNKIYEENMDLIKRFRKARHNLSIYKTELKRRFLKSAYGKNHNMQDTSQDVLFIDNLMKYHAGKFTRINFVERSKYDTTFKEATELLVQVQSKGLLMG